MSHSQQTVCEATRWNWETQLKVESACLTRGNVPLLQTSFLTTLSIPEEGESRQRSFTHSIWLRSSIWEESQTKGKCFENMTSCLHTWSNASSGYRLSRYCCIADGGNTPSNFSHSQCQKCEHLENTEITDCVCQDSSWCLTFFTLSILRFNTCCMCGIPCQSKHGTRKCINEGRKVVLFRREWMHKTQEASLFSHLGYDLIQVTSPPGTTVFQYKSEMTFLSL